DWSVTGVQTCALPISVDAVASDDLHGNALSHVAPHDRRVVAAVEIDADLPGLVEIETAREERVVAGSLEPHVDETVRFARHRETICGVGAVYVDDAGEGQIESR